MDLIKSVKDCPNVLNVVQEGLKMQEEQEKKETYLKLKNFFDARKPSGIICIKHKNAYMDIVSRYGLFDADICDQQGNKKTVHDVSAEWLLQKFLEL